jgi:hypothetical protein
LFWMILTFGAKRAIFMLTGGKDNE